MDEEEEEEEEEEKLKEVEEEGTTTLIGIIINANRLTPAAIFGSLEEEQKEEVEG